MAKQPDLKDRRVPWTKPALVRLGSLRDIAQQGPPRFQGNGQHS